MRRNETMDTQGVCLYVLRALRGWSQGEMAKALDASASTISEYERGKRYVPERIVQRAAVAVGVPVRKLLSLSSLLREIHELMGTAPPPRRDRIEELADEFCLAFEAMGREILQGVLNAARNGTTSPSGPWTWRSPYDLRDRLEGLGKEERLAVVEEAEEYQTWGLCELLCEDSWEAVEVGESSALELAELALHVAERVSGDDDWRACVQAFAWAHLGHARRSHGDLAGAEEAFGRFRELWRKGASVRLMLLGSDRVTDLEALVSGETGSLQ
jgi:transcriptional regulator with XRE-family HTH domain